MDLLWALAFGTSRKKKFLKRLTAQYDTTNSPQHTFFTYRKWHHIHQEAAAVAEEALEAIEVAVAAADEVVLVIAAVVEEQEVR